MKDTKIVFLDLGMMGTLNERDRVLFKEAFISMASGDIHRLKEIILTIGEVKGKIDHTELYNDLDGMVRKYIKLEFSDINLAKVIEELLSLARLYNIKMPASITMLARGVLTLEGVLASCCPGVNILQIITSHISGKTFSEIDIDKEIKHLLRDGVTAFNRSREIPITVADILKMAVKGESKLNIEIVGSQEPLDKLNAMVNRLITCIIIAAILMGSSIICTTKLYINFFGIPALGAAGFLIALILGIKLVYDVIFSKKRK